jgi:ketosteroid isomerase-like protein
MTDSPAATVRKYYELVDSGDTNGLIELFAPDTRYYRPGYPPLVGHEAVERFYREERLIKEGTHALAMVVETGRDVAVHGEFTGVLRNGRQVSVRFADFFSLGSDDRFVRRDTFFFAPLV